tara:strand:+ start:763 stop:1269 length:507 start_codon:yes stop_codon:yes gene_type:complete
MGSVTVLPEHNMRKIVELSGGSLDKYNYYYKGGKLHVNDVTQEELNNGLSTYMDNLDLYLLQPLRDGRSEKMSRLANEYVEQFYPSYRRELFIALAEEARNNGLTNRTAYIDQLLTWIKTVVSAALLAEDAIDSCDTAEEIESISINTEVFSATDPEVTIRGAMAIED